MAQSRMKKVGCVKRDIISELPQNVLEIILCFLPIQDAVRTSFLSRAWRYRWTTIPHLIFNLESTDRVMEKYSQNDDAELQAYRFWISLLSKNGTKQLAMDNSSELEESNAHNFSLLDLSHLRLLGFWFRYTPSCGRFANLTHLELVEATYDFGQGLFPNNFWAPNLKRLIQVYHGISSEYSLAGLQKLEEYSLMLLEDCSEEMQTLNVVKIPGSLHKIEKFSLAYDSLKGLAAGGFPNRLSKPLPYLKFINISDIDFGALSEVSCLVCLIRSAPNLRTLHIVNSMDGREEELEEYQIEDSEECIMLHLEIVSFSDFKGVIAELELVKFLLACSPSLKSLFIHRDCSIKDCASALKITEEMLQYTRASPRAQIRHLESPVNIIYGTNCFDRKLWSDNYSLF
nr:PREDICTED: F-box/FBD/LRR-repeat protein At1g13570-like [Daucus carota subsp. sativus]